MSSPVTIFVDGTVTVGVDEFHVSPPNDPSCLRFIELIVNALFSQIFINDLPALDKII